MPVKPKTVWIVLADGMHARILRQDKHGAPLVPALDRELYDPDVHLFSRDLKSDAPGRSFESASSTRHAMEPRTDPKTHEKQLFAARVAELINTAAAQKTFDQLILVAPPKTLGELRAQLDARARKLVIGEVSRDLRRPVLGQGRDDDGSSARPGYRSLPRRLLGASTRAHLSGQGPYLSGARSTAAVPGRALHLAYGRIAVARPQRSPGIRS